MTYYAHSGKDTRHFTDWQTQRQHLRNVARLARAFARAFGGAEDAWLCGLLHDLGKYGEPFQARLRGEGSGLDHWSMGAWAALRKYRHIPAALAIQGHHVGLDRGSIGALKELDPDYLETQHPRGLRLTSPHLDELLGRLRADGLEPSVTADRKMAVPETHAAMLDVRMLFSTLVDADYLDTAQHFGGGVRRRSGPKLQPERALAVLEQHLAKLSQDVKQEEQASDEVHSVRQDLLQACREAGEGEPGLWTLSAPTGSGKTLAMLAFALAHAARYGLRRIVLVVPYLSIIEQTAKVYRELLEPHFGPDYVLEHHSLAGTQPSAKGERRDEQDPQERRRRLLSENWDAPLILTTSVQLLESLFSNRPSACRKLHRLARSVVLFDEVQTLPLKLALATLSGLGQLASPTYGTSVVFATATQPAFRELHSHLDKRNERGWQPREIADPKLELFRRAARTRVEWPEPGETVTWDRVRQWMAAEPQALCIVNMRRHARDLALALQDGGAEGVFHLSTAMCPAHRRVVLDEVRTRLKKGLPCRLIATQCIEAGVDVDFPRVFRAMGPLEAIAQAAGRCNRHGLNDVGWVRVFVPQAESANEWLYPNGAYKQAADETLRLLRERRPEWLDIHAPSAFERYYRRLYHTVNPDQLDQKLKGAAEQQNYGEVAREYRLIEEEGINVLVPYREAEFRTLVERLDREGLSRAWMTAARGLTVACHTPRRNDPLLSYVRAAPLPDGSVSEDWYVCLFGAGEAHPIYDRTVGLNAPQDAPFWCG